MYKPYYAKDILMCVFKCKEPSYLKKNELNITVENDNPHITGITELWANKDISDVEIGLTGCHV